MCEQATSLFDGMDDWSVLVTAENPARQDGTLDHRRCAALHNMLVEYAWVAEGKALEELERRSFFQRFGDEANEVIDRFDPALRAFLESIIVTEGLPPFYYWVEGITSPSEMFSVHDMFEECEEDHGRFLTLYTTNVNIAPHPLGLVYDQKLHRATMMLGLMDSEFAQPVEEHDELWHPLETVLSNWLHMVEIKKITASQDEAASPKHGPWTWQPYSEAQVDSTVAAFGRLVATVEERIPVEHRLQFSEDQLLSDEQLDAASVPSSCFIRSFLTRVRRPRFKMIAPGLEIPHDPAAFASNQKFTVMDAHSEYGIIIPPVLLFASAERRTVDMDSPNQYTSYNPFCEPFRRGVPRGDHSVIAGLYSESLERCAPDVAEEGFRLLLPFRFYTHGRDRWPKKSDGGPVNNGSVADLFQHGFKPFGGEWWRAQRLEVLFDHWNCLVRTGVWTVGHDGVQGSIDVFRDAGTHLADKYCIKPSW